MTGNQYPPTYRQLLRSRDQRVIAGICAGIGRYLSIDPVVVRVGYLVLVVVTGGVALLAYPLMWIIVPEEPAVPVWSAATQQPPYPGPTPPAPGAPPAA